MRRVGTRAATYGHKNDVQRTYFDSTEALPRRPGRAAEEFATAKELVRDGYRDAALSSLRIALRLLADERQTP